MSYLARAPVERAIGKMLRPRFRAGRPQDRLDWLGRPLAGTSPGCQMSDAPDRKPKKPSGAFALLDDRQRMEGVDPREYPPHRAPVARLVALWEDRRGDRAMPRRADFSVPDLKPWLGDLALLDVIDDGADFRYRVHGVNLAQRAGFDLSVKLLSSLPDPPRGIFAHEYRRALAHRTPRHFVNPSILDRSKDHYEKLILPLSSDGETIDMLLAGIWVHE